MSVDFLISRTPELVTSDEIPLYCQIFICAPVIFRSFRFPSLGKHIVVRCQDGSDAGICNSQEWMCQLENAQVCFN